MVGETIESVMAQQYPNLEHIVVDGGSTDGTLDVLSRYPHLRVITKPDAGPFDGLNKGIRIATGTIIGILNSDDVYPLGTLPLVAQAFRDEDVEMVVGKASFFDSSEMEGTHGIDELHERRAPRLTLDTVLWDAPMIEARFLKTEVYERIGLYDPVFRLGADLDFVIRLSLAKVTASYLDEVVYRYRRHPGSLTNDPAAGRVRASATPLYADRLALMERFLEDPGVPRNAKTNIRKWHSIHSCRAVSVAVLERRYLAPLHIAARGWRYDNKFLVMFTRYYAGRLKKLLSMWIGRMKEP
jgi:glycosyltransferase